MTQQEIIEAIEKMTVLELSELVDALKEKFNVSAAMPMAAVAAAPGAAAGAAEPVEEKTQFDVILKSAGDQKIKVIKEVRAVTDLGLKEAKDLVEGAPQPVKTDVSKEEAQAIKEKIEAVGGVVEIK